MDEQTQENIQPTAADDNATETVNETATETAEHTEAENGNGAAQEEGRRTFTQEELNGIVKERLDRQTGKFLQRLGLESMDGIDELLEHAKAYSEAQELMARYQLENESLRQEMAFRDNEINPKKVDDVKAYFKGKGLELTGDNLKAEMETHPEWRVSKPKTTTVRTLSPEKNSPKGDDGWETALRLFGMR